MARKAARKPRNERRNGLQEALTALINNQALLVASSARMDERFARSDERFARSDERLAQLERRTDERFARIEAELTEIKRILLHHEVVLEALPEAIRQKIGFQSG